MEKDQLELTLAEWLHYVKPVNVYIDLRPRKVVNYSSDTIRLKQFCIQNGIYDLSTAASYAI